MSIAVALTVMSQGQVTSFESLETELNHQTLSNLEIKHGADSLMLYWHNQNPNDSGLAPLEKQYNRQQLIKQSRSGIIGQNDLTPLQLRTMLATTQASLAFCTTGPADNTWQEVGPKSNSTSLQTIGLVSSMAIDPTNQDVIYIGAGESSGIFKTTTGGQSWINVTDYLGVVGLGISELTIDPTNSSTILAGSMSTSFGYMNYDYSGQGYGVYRSTNGGATWSATDITATPGDGFRVNAIRFHPTNHNIVYCVASKGIYKSTNNGQNWTLLYTLTIADHFFLDLEISPSNPNFICVSTVLGQAPNANLVSSTVFFSTDGGSTFLESRPPNSYSFINNSLVRGTQAIALDVTPVDGNSIYAFFVSNPQPTGGTNYLYKGSLSGNTLNWTLHYADSYASLAGIGDGCTICGNWGRYRNQFEMSNLNTEVAYVGGNVLYKLNKAQVNTKWSVLTDYYPTLTDHADIRDIQLLPTAFNNQDVVFIANDGGTSKSVDGGTTWANLNGTGLGITEFWGLASWESNDVLVGGAMHNGTTKINSTDGSFATVVSADGGYTAGIPNNPSTGVVVLNLNLAKFDANGLYAATTYYFPGSTKLSSKFDIAESTNSPGGYDVYYSSKNKRTELVQVNLTTDVKTVLFDSTIYKTNHAISVVKVAPSNTSVLYMACEEPAWNTNNLPTGKFWRRDANGTWNDLSQNIFKKNTTSPIVQWTYITDIAIDPLDPARVWVGMAYYDPNAENRIFFSADSGLTWVDVSTGLTPFPINCLTYQEGSDDVIYAGADAGVYFWDKPNNTWQCFNNGLPPAIVTKIDVHPCKGVLYASTYGRGIWQAPIVVSDGAPEPVAINTTIPYGTTVVYEKSLAVQPGVTLTIQGEVRFGRGKSLTILPNALVILDGGTITNNPDCGESWEGMQVRGNANLPQIPTTQGKLITKSNGGRNAIISNARTAISNVGWGGNDFLWGTQGGILECANTFFLNNCRDVQLISYHDVLVNGFEKDYKADFKNCTFTRDANFAQDNITASVSMWDVIGPIFSGCTFDIENIAYTGPVERKRGLFTIAAAYKLTNTHANEGNSFAGYYKAIESKLITRADKFITIKNTSFTNNLFGAHLECTANSRVLFNTFNVLGGSGIDPTVNFSYGLYFDYSTSYTCTENTFIKTTINSLPTAGAVFKSSGTAANRVYRNNFSKLLHGSQALDRNRSIDGQTGLEYKCNFFGGQISSMSNKNSIDALIGLSLLQPNAAVPQEYGIQENQGYFNQGSSNPEDLANNVFTEFFYPNLINQSGMIPFYYYYDENATARMKPRYNVALQQPTYLQKVYFGSGIVADYNLHCQQNVTESGGPGKTVADLQATLSNADALVQNKRNLYTQLLNGGNTPELEADILLANQPDYIALYVDLLGMSPYVDVPQILDLIHKNDFPEMALRNIILANPHSGRDPEVWEALVNRNPAVSQQTLLDIESGRATRTAKDVLEAEMGFYSGNAQRSVNDLLYYYADSTYADTDSLKTLLQSRNEFTYVLQLAEHYLNKGQYTHLQNMWSTLNAEWYSEGDLLELPDWQSLYSTLGTAFADGQRYATLNETTLNNLQSLDNQAVGAVKHRANAILRSYGLGTPYVEPMSFYEEDNNKTDETTQRPSKPVATFNLYPNPAKDYVELRWDWFEQGMNTDMRIVVRNFLGAQIMKQQIKDYKNNVAVVPTNLLQPGVYLFEVQTTDGNVLFVEKVTVIKE